MATAPKIAPNMQLWDPRGAPTLAQRDAITQALDLKEAEILELGCGAGELARAVAAAHPRASLTALEVDGVQHTANLAGAQLPNLVFAEGSAERIPLGDESFDVVLVIKALHHVPADRLDKALSEIRRVLKPGGQAYIAEPVFAGAFNEIMRVFHDEEQPRLAAFEAVKKAVAKGGMALEAETFFFAPLHVADFADFERRFIQVTHSELRLTKAQMEQVQKKFTQHMSPKGAHFKVPMRADVLRKTG